MKSLGFVLGLLMAIVIWIMTYLLGSLLVDKVPDEDRALGLVAGLLLLGAGAMFGRKAWHDTIEHFEGVGLRMRKRRRERDAAAIRVARAESLLHADERWWVTNLARRLNDSRALATGLTGLVKDADLNLASAEKAIAENHSLIFWDLIGIALGNLATYTAHLELLIDNARHYEADGARLEHRPPTFDLEMSTLPDAPISEQRMADLIRRAHERPDFVVIYEMRSRDSIGVADFGTMGEVVVELQGRLNQATAQMSQVLTSAPPK